MEDKEICCYVVYPGSEKLDIGDRKPVAICSFEGHAKELVKKYGKFGEVVPVDKSKLSEILLNYP